MKFDEIELGSSAIASRFLADVEMHSGPRSLFFVSPFVELTAKTSIARRIIGALLTAKSVFADAALISDHTPAREKDFRDALTANPALEGALYLRRKLHAKAGLITLRSGYQFGFLGSANLTLQGLSQNQELVIGLVNNLSGRADCQLCSDLESWIRNTLSSSHLVTINQ